MRFNIKLPEVGAFDFPYAREGEITFHIRRLGHPDYAGLDLSGPNAKILEEIMRESGMKAGELRKAQKAGETSAIFDNMPAHLFFKFAQVAGRDSEAVARGLVERTEGPLAFDDDGSALENWHANGEGGHLGAALLKAHPGAGEWIVECAGEQERIYQDFLGGSAKNSPTTSPPSSTAGETVTDSPSLSPVSDTADDS